MKFRLLIVIILWGASAAAQQPGSGPPGSDPSKTSNAERFNGTWGVTLTCADFKDAGGGAKGYTYRFLVQVKDGMLRGDHGQEGMPDWLRYEGRIQPDGSAEIQARGLTGNPDFNVGRISKSIPYAYRVRALFDDSRGTGSRLDLRPCDVVFTKQ